MFPTDTVSLALFIIQEAVKLEPSIAAEIQTLLAKGDPTDADWEALRASVASKSYESYVPATALPPVAVPAIAAPPAPPEPAVLQVDPPRPAVSAAPEAAAAPETPTMNLWNS